MLRVMHVIGSLERGGAEKILTNLVRTQSKFVRHTVVTLSKAEIQQDGEAEFRALGVKIVSLSLRNKDTRSNPLTVIFRGISAPLMVAKIAWIIRPHIINSWMYQSDLICGIIGRLLGIPVIWGIFLSNLNPRYYKKSTIAIIRLAGLLSKFLPSRIISCTEAGIATHIKMGYPPNKIKYIPPGTDTELFVPTRDDRLVSVRTRPGVVRNFVVGMVAREDPQKNFDLLFGGFSLFQSKVGNTELWLAGGYGIDRSNPRLLALERRYGLSGKVKYLGRVKEIENFYTALDIFVLASFGEGFPISVCEAMSSEVPCIVSNVGDIRKLIDVNTGVLLRDETPHELANALSVFFEMESSRRSEIGRNSRRKIVDQFSDKAASIAYLKLYAEVAKINIDQIVS
jgi:glycosyltransferase involved in cell wall biosynthesis